PTVHSELSRLVLVRHGDERGALVCKRRKGDAAISLVSATLDEQTHWTATAVEALRAATGVTVEPSELEPAGFRSSERAPFSMTLLVRVQRELDAGALSAPRAADELERGLVFGATGLKRACSSIAHYLALEQLLNDNALRGKHRFTVV
ncbi:MAG: hypothetical protein U0269_31250, partial [Polyangiales bacterium]